MRRQKLYHKAYCLKTKGASYRRIITNKTIDKIRAMYHLIERRLGRTN